jgi:decaprenyl-phosphate phosphoribosyltransferase
MMIKFPDILLLMRPKHWIKNIFVFAPLIFAGVFLEFSQVAQASIAFLGFCLAASIIYIINDLIDAPLDAKHPQKKIDRPIASGRVSKKTACLFAIILGLFFIILSFIDLQTFFIIALYIIMNIFYSLWLKHIAIVDIFCIAIGFVLRIIAGAVAINVPLSIWMFITTLCIALYLASIKRQKEFERNLILPLDEQDSRKVLKTYTLDLIKRYAEISAISTLMFYSFFVITSHPDLTLTIPIVIFGLFRYNLIVETSALGESPTDLVFEDLPLTLTVLAWLSFVLFTLWPS